MPTTIVHSGITLQFGGDGCAAMVICNKDEAAVMFSADELNHATVC